MGSLICSTGSNWRRSPERPPRSEADGPAEGLSAKDREYPGVAILSTAFSNKSKVTALAWSPDATQLVATCDEGQVVLMNIQVDEDSGKPLVTPIQMHSMHKTEAKDNVSFFSSFREQFSIPGQASL